MTAQKSWRKRVASVLATATAALVVASGLALAPTAAFADEPIVPTPIISVSKSSNLNPDGEEITITGSGFDTSAVGLAPYYPCDDTANASKGFYVQVGWIKENWRPSTGGANNVDRKGGPNSWFADDLNCIAPSKWTLAGDGTASFTYTVEVSVANLGELPEGARYAVFTNGAGGGVQPVNEISHDITFASATLEPEPEPEVAEPTLSPSITKASTAGLEIKADLKNIVSTTGAYVSLIEAGTSTTLTADNMGIGVDWVTPARFSNGSATATLKAAAAKLDRSKSYEIISWRGHTLPTVGTIFNVAPLTVTAAQWDAVFAKPVDPKPAVKIPFTDIKKGDKFYKEIAWMYTAKVTTGVKQADGTVKYQPKANVTREAMAAFLFRQYGESDYKAPKTSPFSDIKTTDKFYKEIAWMKSKGVSTGTKQASGLPKYDAKTSVTREAMSAFLYRIDKGSKPNAPKVSPFSDVKTTDKFYKEISWMSSTGISTGIKQSSGKPAYAPKNSVTREAMAAFLFRVDAK